MSVLHISDVLKAAEEGNPAAQFNLGVILLKGEGLPEDHAEAAKWFREAAVQGVASAQYNLGLMLVKGKGVPKDEAEAMQWFSRAAEQGVTAAKKFIN